MESVSVRFITPWPEFEAYSREPMPQSVLTADEFQRVLSYELGKHAESLRGNANRNRAKIHDAITDASNWVVGVAIGAVAGLIVVVAQALFHLVTK